MNREGGAKPRPSIPGVRGQRDLAERGHIAPEN